MKLRANLAMLAGAAAVLCAATAGPMSPEPAKAFGNPRIIINVAGPQAGTIEFDNVSESFFPELLINEDTGDLLMPTNYCGLRVTHVGGIWWHDGSGDVVEAENHGEVSYEPGDGYMFMGEDITDQYLGGVEFTGALPTCDDNQPWYFPTPLSYGGNGPQFGAQKLILELDDPPGFQPSIEFLDHAHEPMELPDLFEDWEPPAGWEEYCEKIPEFCEEEKDPDPDPNPWSEIDEVLWGCTVFDPRDCPDYPSREPLGLTLGCAAYSTGCDPKPQPVGTFKVAGPPPARNAELWLPPLKVLNQVPASRPRPWAIRNGPGKCRGLSCRRSAAVTQSAAVVCGEEVNPSLSARTADGRELRERPRRQGCRVRPSVTIGGNLHLAYAAGFMTQGRINRSYVLADGSRRA